MPVAPSVPKPAPSPRSAVAPVLAVEGLSLATRAGLLTENVSLSIAPGEMVGLVGESGSGKSITALAVLRLLPEQIRIASGRILFAGHDLATAPMHEVRAVRGNSMGMVFQEPLASLNPVFTCGDEIMQPLRLHRGLSRSAARKRAVELLDLVGIADSDDAIDRYPHQMSGGQRQRVMIASAIACEPQLLIADEPTTALDVTVQAQVLALINRLRREMGLACLLITHDLGVVNAVCDRAYVMHAGRIVEEGPLPALFTAPSDDYTRELLSASLGGSVPRVVSAATADATPLLRVETLTRVYKGASDHKIVAVDNVSLDVGRGEVLGIVGESGSGKTTLARMIMHLVEPTFGRVLIEGEDFAALRGTALKAARRNIQMVFQDPYSSLNPRHKVRDIIAEPLVVHGAGDAAWIDARVKSLLEMVGLPTESGTRYPHEFSGGQRQRIAIARAIALEPKLIVADEPVSSLDVSIQAQIVRLLAELRARLGLSMIFISHDLGVVRHVSDRIAVMKNGVVVETGAAADVFERPQHAYTRALLAAIPKLPGVHVTF